MPPFVISQETWWDVRTTLFLTSLGRDCGLCRVTYFWRVSKVLAALCVDVNTLLLPQPIGYKQYNNLINRRCAIHINLHHFFNSFHSDISLHLIQGIQLFSIQSLSIYEASPPQQLTSTIIVTAERQGVKGSSRA